MASIVLKSNEERTVSLLWMGAETEADQEIILAGSGASVTVQALFVGKRTEQLSSRLKVTHAAPNTTSKLVVRSTLSDSAKLDFNGLVTINPGAKGSNAWLAAHVLLLSPDAKGVATPGLEILENDVKAGRATTVGRLREAELFYLMSHGLSLTQARRLIIEGFMESMLARFPPKLAAKARQELMV